MPPKVFKLIKNTKRVLFLVPCDPQKKLRGTTVGSIIADVGIHVYTQIEFFC